MGIKSRLLFAIAGLGVQLLAQAPACYDPADPDDLRLWDGMAPGALGADPCLDIPFLRVFRPEGQVPVTDVAIVVYPGGGYNDLTDQNEQTPVAQSFAKMGITAFVLYYRLVQKDGTYRYPVPMWDGQRAIRYVRFNAAQYGINVDHVGAFGFSAGGHLASTLAIHFGSNFNLSPEDTMDQTDARPDFLGLGYPVISMDPAQYASMPSLRHLLYGYSGDELAQLEDYLSGQKHVDSKTPPSFLFVSDDDKEVNPQNSSLFYQAMLTASVSAEAHFFQKGKHGAGIAASEPYESVWPALFHNWLCERKLIATPWKLVPEPPADGSIQ